jgi:DNA-binding transcriptional regulator YiaG
MRVSWINGRLSAPGDAERLVFPPLAAESVPGLSLVRQPLTRRGLSSYQTRLYIMNDKGNAPSRAHTHTSYIRDSRDADRLRELIGNAGLSQRAAARELGVDERTMRYWCSGDQTPPTMALRGLDPFVRHRENLIRMIRDNEELIAAIESGRITGMGYGDSLADPSSAAIEVARLRRKNEELRLLQRQDAAWERRQAAFAALVQQSSAEAVAELDASWEELQAVEAEVAKLTAEIRAGLR